MNKFFFGLLTLSLFIFAGCGNDDDGMTGTVSNEFTYDGTTFTIPNGFLNGLGASLNGTFDWDIFLTSSGITSAGTNLTGAGEFIYLDLNTDSETGLIPGTYTWGDSRENLSIVPGSLISIDYNLSTFTGTQVTATDGTVEIAIDGTETTLEFTLTLSDGNTVTGSWRGVLQEI